MKKKNEDKHSKNAKKRNPHHQGTFKDRKGQQVNYTNDDYLRILILDPHINNEH